MGIKNNKEIKKEMTKELDEKLCKDYPKIFVDRHADMRTTAMCWGFECGDGWYWLIDQLCAKLQGMTDANSHLPERYPQVIATQVKEKFGGLRFYVQSTSDVQDGMISLAESMSYDICESCGSTKNVGHTDGWIYTRCEECAKKNEMTMASWKSNEQRERERNETKGKNT